MSTLEPPEEWRHRIVYTLDILLFMRHHLEQGVTPELFIGPVHVRAMGAFVEGLEVALYYNGHPDETYQEFLRWLRDVKQEFPAGGGWEKKCLDECGGDHLAAIRRFLDFVAEFSALKAATSGGAIPPTRR